METNQTDEPVKASRYERLNIPFSPEERSRWHRFLVVLGRDKSGAGAYVRMELNKIMDKAESDGVFK